MTTTVQDTTATASLYNTGTSTAAKSSADDTQNRFLSLLVAQMKNQDPLNPLDNAQVTSQMAQLSTVQGIENMNKSLQTLTQSLSSNQMTQAANLIGHGVLVPGNGISPASGQNAFGFDLPLPADQVKVSITDAAGHAVRTMNVGAVQSGVTLLAWDGLSDGGDAVASGQYQFSVQAVQGGQSQDATALSLGVVDSVSQNSQGVALNLAGNRSAGFADVRQVF